MKLSKIKIFAFYICFFVFCFTFFNLEAQEIKNIKFIEDLKTQSGQSAKVSFEIDDRSLTGIMKPVRYINIEDIKMRRWTLKHFQKINAESYRNSEYAVYLFDRFIETGFVPETFVYLWKDRTTYTIQVWLEDREYGIWSVPDDMEAFDFMTGNIDRFYDRNLIKSGGKLYAIDNEVAFPSDIPSLERFKKQWIDWRRPHIEFLQLSPEMKEKINNMDTEKLYEVLAPAIKETKHIDLMIERIKHLRTVIKQAELIAERKAVTEKDRNISDGKNLLNLIIAPVIPENDMELIKLVVERLLIQKRSNPEEFIRNVSLLGHPSVNDYFEFLSANYDGSLEVAKALFLFSDIVKNHIYALDASKNIRSMRVDMITNPNYERNIKNTNTRSKGLRPK
jgi:hypothetical protein